MHRREKENNLGIVCLNKKRKKNPSGSRAIRFFLPSAGMVGGTGTAVYVFGEHHPKTENFLRKMSLIHYTAHFQKLFIIKSIKFRRVY